MVEMGTLVVERESPSKSVSSGGGLEALPNPLPASERRKPPLEDGKPAGPQTSSGAGPQELQGDEKGLKMTEQS